MNTWQTKNGHDVLTLLGIGVVAVAAAVLSFASLQDLGERAGYATGLAALLPIAIDAQAVVATRAWLSANTPARARDYARRLALGAIGFSVIGNAGEHVMTALTIATPWWVVVPIASVPPIALAATAHLGALLANRSDRAPATAVEVEPIAQADPAPTIDVPTNPAGDLRESTPATKTERASVPAPAVRSLSDLREEFAAAIEAGSVDPTSAESIRKALRCSPKRARQLRDEHDRPRLAVVGEKN